MYLFQSFPRYLEKILQAKQASCFQWDDDHDNDNTAAADDDGSFLRLIS